MAGGQGPAAMPHDVPPPVDQLFGTCRLITASGHGAFHRPAAPGRRRTSVRSGLPGPLDALKYYSETGPQLGTLDAPTTCFTRCTSHAETRGGPRGPHEVIRFTTVEQYDPKVTTSFAIPRVCEPYRNRGIQLVMPHSRELREVPPRGTCPYCTRYCYPPEYFPQLPYGSDNKVDIFNDAWEPQPAQVLKFVGVPDGSPTPSRLYCFDCHVLFEVSFVSRAARVMHAYNQLPLDVQVMMHVHADLLLANILFSSVNESVTARSMDYLRAASGQFAVLDRPLAILTGNCGIVPNPTSSGNVGYGSQVPRYPLRPCAPFVYHGSMTVDMQVYSALSRRPPAGLCCAIPLRGPFRAARNRPRAAGKPRLCRRWGVLPLQSHRATLAFRVPPWRPAPVLSLFRRLHSLLGY